MHKISDSAENYEVAEPSAVGDRHNSFFVCFACELAQLLGKGATNMVAVKSDAHRGLSRPDITQ